MRDFGGANGDSCAYRGRDGKRCAIGVLISDDLYDAEFEGKPIKDLPAKVRRAIGMTTKARSDLLGDLQSVHDLWSVDVWIEGLQSVARTHGLQFQPPA